MTFFAASVLGAWLFHGLIRASLWGEQGVSALGAMRQVHAAIRAPRPYAACARFDSCPDLEGRTTEVIKQNPPIGGPCFV
jgi:hypothetical protein